MKKEKTLSRYDAINRLALFLKLRKGKVISEKTVKDFYRLTDALLSNFKSSNLLEITEERNNDFEIRLRAIKSMHSKFIEFDSGGTYKISDISQFSLYKDGKYRVSISGELKEITKNDFKVLQLITNTNIPYY